MLSNLSCARPQHGRCQLHASRRAVVARASDEKQTLGDRVGAVATALSVALVLSAGSPDEALAARSAGRAGGSNFQSRAAPARPAPAPSAPAPSSGPNISINTYSPSPFGFSPFGFSPFGFSPFGYGGAVVVGAPAPAFGIGSIFSLVFGLAFVSILFSALSSAFSGANRDNKKKDDDQW